MLSKASSIFRWKKRKADSKVGKHTDAGLSGPTSQVEAMDSKKPYTLDQMLKYRAQLTPNEPLLSYPRNGTEYIAHTAEQVNTYAEKAAHQYSKSLPRRPSSKEKPKVVALLGPADLGYVVTMFALYRLGYTVVALSPRLAREGYAHLLDILDVHELIYHESQMRMANTLDTTTEDLRIHRIVQQDVFMNPTYDLETSPLGEVSYDMEVESKHLAVIIHSSGSTGLPKPVKLSHSTLVMAASKTMNMRALSCVPFFHGFGLNGLHRGIYAGKQFWFYNASQPLTSKNLIDAIENNDLEIFFCVPYALKLLAESDTGIDALKKCKLVWFAGSACPDDLGDSLTEKGVRLIGDYGLSECGPLMTTMRPEDDHAWNYLRPMPHTKPYMKFEERTEGMLELVCLDGMPWKTASNRDDGSYATKDLFEKHPSIDGAYRFVSRQDDTLVLYNGEKASPSVPEGKVRQHPLIAEAVMIGSGQSELGMVLILSDAAKDMSSSTVIDQVWSTIQEGQKEMPDYGKVARTMIITLPAGTDYPRTDKGTVIRQQFNRKFAQEIEDAYIEKSSEEHLDLNEHDLHSFVREEIQNILNIDDGEEINEETDLFSIGVDSLQSTQLRRTFQARLDLKGSKLPMNFIYENPSINQICSYLLGIMTGQSKEQQDPNQAFSALLDKYGDLSVEQPPSGEYTVVLTGATGSLGAHLLVQLIQNDSVKSVYCLVRAKSSQNALNRVYKSLQQRKVYQQLNESEKDKIIALASDLSARDLGLDPDTYRQICLGTTTVIHAAWPVNFNMNLASFQPDIVGTRSLIDVCLSPQRVVPATFSFCSSISTAMDLPNNEAVSESVPGDLEPALDMGYAQSKLVAENLCIRAAEQTGLKAYIMRIGQIIGDTVHGVWNASEAMPLMIQTSQTVGGLPAIEETHRWLPVDIVAKTILEASLKAQAPAGSVLNIVNPAGFDWKRDLLPKLHDAGLEFQEMAVEDWLQKLRESDQDGKANPPIKLLSYFETVYGNGNDKGRGEGREWEASNALKYSQAFSTGWEISQNSIDRIVKYFREEAWSATTNTQRDRQSSWSSENTFGEEEQRVENGETVRYPEEQGKNQAHARMFQDLNRNERADSQGTLHTDEETLSSNHKIYWNDDKNKIDIHDAEQLGQTQVVSAGEDVDIGTLKGHHVRDFGVQDSNPMTGPRSVDVSKLEDTKLSTTQGHSFLDLPSKTEIEEIKSPKVIEWNGTNFECS